MSGNKSEYGLQSDLEEITRERVAQPPMYEVVLHNDDYTPMDFVIDVLGRFFHMQHEQATEVMLKVHYEGKGRCGIFTSDVAETKVQQVMEYAKEHQHPLLCTKERV